MKKKGEGGGAFWEMMVAVLMVLVAAVAFAEQANHGQGQDNGKPKRVIHGKPVERGAIERLLDESDGDAEAGEGKDGKTISELKGRFRIDKNKPVEDAALDFIDKHRNAFGLKDPKEELKVRLKSIDTKGNTHLRLQQMYHGVPIWGEEFLVHINKNGEIYYMQPNKLPTPDIDTTPLVTADEALNIAKTDLKIPQGATIWPPEKELVIFNNKLSYKILVEDWLYFIDAKTGAILSKDFIAKRELVTGTGVNFNNQTTSIGLYKKGGTFYLASGFQNASTIHSGINDVNFVFGNNSSIGYSTMLNFVNNQSISAFDADNTIVLDNNQNYTDTFQSNVRFMANVTNFISRTDGQGRLTSGVNILQNHNKIYKYFNGTFQRNSWDGNYGSLLGIAHGTFADGPNNSEWSPGRKIITYGEGDNSTNADYTQALDTAAHETGHAITQAFIPPYGFSYKAHSGAMDEHIADLWAIMVDNSNYLIGEDHIRDKTDYDAVRDFKNPDRDRLTGRQKCYMKDFLYTSEDNFGVHTNSGILNLAAYNLIQALGGDVTGRNNVAGIYYNAYPLLNKNAHFLDLRDALIAADSSAGGTITQQFASVGIDDPAVKEVFQYDNSTSTADPITLSDDETGYGALFVPYGNKKSVNSGYGKLAGANIVFSSDSANTQSFDVVVEPTDGATFTCSTSVSKFGKPVFVDLGCTNVREPFYITVKPTDKAHLHVVSSSAPKDGVNVKKANFITNNSGNKKYLGYDQGSSESYFMIRPIIVYHDDEKPTSTITLPSVPDGCGKVDTDARTVYYNKAFFDNHTSITIGGTAVDAVEQNGEAGSGVKKVSLTFEGYSTATHYTNGVNPTFTYTKTPEDKSDDASFSSWEYNWNFTDQNGAALPDGYYKITAKATDMVNNAEAAHTETPASNVMEVVLDRRTS